MAEVEYGGIKLGGSKLLLIIPLIGTLGGGLWAGFEFYKDYMDMKEQIQEYVAPDLSEFDKQLAVLHEDIKIAKETVAVFKDEIIIIRDSVNDSVDMMRDTKHDLRDEIIRTEKLLEKVENDIDDLEDKRRFDCRPIMGNEIELPIEWQDKNWPIDFVSRLDRLTELAYITGIKRICISF